MTMLLYYCLLNIKILQLRLAKNIPVQPIQSHTKPASERMPLEPIQPASVQTYKQCIQTTKQYKPARIQIPLYKPASIQIPQQLPAAPSTIAPPLIPLQAHHIKWIQAPIYRYNKQLQTAI